MHGERRLGKTGERGENNQGRRMKSDFHIIPSEQARAI
jgi:hypothetical protein